MLHQSSSHREDSSTRKDLKKLQQREQRIVTKLAEAREAQARALKRFAEAQARVLLVENRLQAIRARLQTAQSSPAHAQTTSSSSANPAAAQPVQPTSTPASDEKPGIIQTSADQEAEQQRDFTHPSAGAPEPASPRTDQRHEYARSFTVTSEPAEQPGGNIELLTRLATMSAGIPRETLPQTGKLAAPDLLAEDSDETARRTAVPPASATAPAPQEERLGQAEEDALLAAILAMTRVPDVLEDEIQKSARQAVQKAEQALNEVNLAILNGTLSGFEANNSLREAEAQLAQARAQLVEVFPATEAPASAASASDLTDKLPVMHDRDARMQEPM